MTWRFYTRWEPLWRDFAIAIEREDRGGAASVVIELRTVPLDPAVPPPEDGWLMFRFRDGGRAGDGRQFLQAALDAAWAAGLRPSQGVEEVGALAATRAHLSDMQKLVFERNLK